MKFNFKKQQYQTDAVNSVINIFKGQAYKDSFSYIRDIGKDNKVKVKDIQVKIKDEEVNDSNQKIKHLTHTMTQATKMMI